MSDYLSANDAGAVGDGQTDDAQAIQTAIDLIASDGGGTLVLGHGQTYRCDSGLVLEAGVTLDMNSGKLRFVLTEADDRGLRLRNNAHVRTGEIEIVSNSPGASGASAQAGVHSPICVGALYGEGLSGPTEDEGVSGWSIRDMKLHTNKWVERNPSGEPGVMIGGVAIQIVGGANNGIIENIEVPSNPRMLGGVLMDWGFVGDINSSPPQTGITPVQNMQNNRQRFDEGTAYTTHPNTILVRNVTIGVLSAPYNGQDTGSFGCRLSACYNIMFENIRVSSVTNAAFVHTGGDLGFEFAPNAIKPFAVKNNRFVNCAVEEGNTAYLVYSDSYADNVARTQPGYAPRLDPLMETNLVFRNVVGKGPGTPSANYGVRALQQRGGSFVDCDASGYKQGFNVDERTRGISLIRPHAHFNREHGVMIDHGIHPPQDIIVSQAWCHDNMRDPGDGYKAGIFVGASERVVIRGARLGRVGEYDPTQVFGVQVHSSALETTVEDCWVNSARSDGYGYVLLMGEVFNRMGLFRNNGCTGAFTANPYAGLTVIPVERKLAADGRRITRYIADSGRPLDNLELKRGDRIEYTNPAPGGAEGLICTQPGIMGHSGQVKDYGVVAG